MGNNATIGDVAVIVGVLGGTLLLAGGCNAINNNRHVETEAYTIHSRATGLYGHKEFTRYADGSMDVKLYPSLSHRMLSSELYQDFDGDGLVDRIRVNGSELSFHRLKKLLVREQDYYEHSEDFIEADELLRELMEKYDE